MAKFTRRSFIRTGALVGAGAALPRVGAARVQATKTYDVAVLGAGMAGLAAGRDLARAGLDVLILEANHRVGGRMETLKTHTDHGLETGAGMIHGSRAEHWEVVREFGIETRPWPSEGLGSSTWDPESGFQKADYERMASLQERMRREYRAYRGEDISYQAFLDRVGFSEEEQNLASAWASGWTAETDEISVRAVIEDVSAWDIYVDENYQVIGGNQLIAEKMAATLGETVQLSSLVKAIDWKRGAVKVTYEREGKTESALARRTIVTLPMGILQSGKPSFSPELPAWKRRSIDALPLGSAVVLHFWFKDKFWLEKGVSGWSTRGGRISFLDPHPEGVSEAPLFGYVTGSASRELSKLGEKEGLQRALDLVQEPFQGLNIRERLEWSNLRDWNSDPYTLGSYSFPAPGGYRQRYIYATPIEDTLYFAGESTEAPPHYQTVHGAYKSGRRAAREILSSLGVEAPT
jgi:monoamine oxidase